MTHAVTPGKPQMPWMAQGEWIPLLSLLVLGHSRGILSLYFSFSSEYVFTLNSIANQYLSERLAFYIVISLELFHLEIVIFVAIIFC